MVGDNKYLILRRLVEAAGGEPLAGDLETDLLEKYLRAIGGTPVPGDDFNVLLRKVVIIKGGTPTPGDTEWNLLVKWLQTLDECRKCGDMIIDLWRRILAESAEPSEPTGPPPDAPFLSWVGPQTFFVSPTLAGGFLEIQHGPAAEGPFTDFLDGIATPGADYLLDFTGEGEPGGLWYRGRVSIDQSNWSEWGSPAWDDNS